MESLDLKKKHFDSAMTSKQQEPGFYVRMRKFRGTNDFDYEELTDGHKDVFDRHKNKTSRKLLLPKIDDVKLISPVLHNDSKQLSTDKVKILNNIKIQKLKLESRYMIKSDNHRIKSLKLKKAKGVWTPVKSGEEMSRRELYVPLIPLEKTDLLTKTQLKQLMPYTVKELKSEEYLFSLCRPCKVILKRLTREEMTSALNKTCSVEVSFVNNTFSPDLASSPLVSSNLVEEVEDSRQTSRYDSTDLESINGNSKDHVTTTTNNTIIELNSTYEVDVPITPMKRVTWEKPSSTGVGPNNNMNGTYEITPTQDKGKTPKSALKTNSRSSTNNNRRVTFNDTSVIIIHDADMLYTSPTPTHFEENRRKPSFLKTSAGRTPANISVLKNVNSVNKSENSSIKKTQMPDFKKIHKRLFDQMLDIKQHAKEKLKRSQMLLSGRKPSVTVKNLTNNHIKNITMRLKKDGMKKIDAIKPNTAENLIIKKPKLDIKEKHRNPIVRKQQVVALVNKNRPKPTTIRENNKVYIEGIRSNRRFELLMNLRKSQEKNNKN